MGPNNMVVKAIEAPGERSIPPTSIVRATPVAIIRLREATLNIFRIFVVVPKEGEMTNKRRNMMRMAKSRERLSPFFLI
jgi:hypothetical protein